jgi:hypothetical protein
LTWPGTKIRLSLNDGYEAVPTFKPANRRGVDHASAAGAHNDRNLFPHGEPNSHNIHIDNPPVDGSSKWRRGAVGFGGAGLVKVSERQEWCVAGEV